ncbi:zinc cadmium resistance [Trichoderma arundinaceum]|uniref:Zinc cadmium resistance n=1 Tax=Trichoderma arundinaceum TaxID=490622 RepID=A0A395NEQ3_TRIAR|nr:zinc cadmium resistance [Trichoderma arundinaceum]
MVSERPNPPPQEFTFGWARATLLGAFFNGVFLLALGVSILVQAIERFVNVTEHDHEHSHNHSHDHAHDHAHDHNSDHGHEILHEEDAATRINDGTAPEAEARPTSASSGHHEHRHVSVEPSRPGRDLGMFGVLIHVVGDAINNIGVIASALIIWKAHGEARYYADPAIGVFISIMIFLTAWPLTRNSGRILLQIAPNEINLEDVKHDIEMIPGVESVHELHIWRLDQRKSIASAHVVVDGRTVKSFTDKAKIITECLHAYGIHSATLQPEVHAALDEPEAQSTAVSLSSDSGPSAERRRGNSSDCQILCGSRCGVMRCCTPIHIS